MYGPIQYLAPCHVGCVRSNHIVENLPPAHRSTKVRYRLCSSDFSEGTPLLPSGAPPPIVLSTVAIFSSLQVILNNTQESKTQQASLRAQDKCYLNLISKKHWTKPNWELLCEIITLYCKHPGLENRNRQRWRWSEKPAGAFRTVGTTGKAWLVFALVTVLLLWRDIMAKTSLIKEGH